MQEFLSNDLKLLLIIGKFKIGGRYRADMLLKKLKKLSFAINLKYMKKSLQFGFVL